MKYYSTNNRDIPVSLKEAVLSGLAPDGGLYLPKTIPQMSKSFFKNIHKMNFQEISREVSKKLFKNDIPSGAMDEIIEKSFNFPIPLKEIRDGVYVLELFHGPTLAFKDFGARFMANLVSCFAGSMERELTILVATSGDTGSAVANGFYNMKGVRVIILYPSKRVSKIQEAQLTTLGKNIIALEIKGTFDDCQKMVKEAFLDKDLMMKMNLTSSNSINIARLLPQSFYYFSAYAQISENKKPVVFSVPSGNFGNLTGGLLAKRMGLPVKLFVASTNINDTVPEYFSTGIFKPKPSKMTISNAMDVGNPSNFMRMLALYENKYNKIKKDIISFRFTDLQTKAAIREVYAKYNYITDPHGAVAYLGLKKYLKMNTKPACGIFLETAHPAKFRDTIEETLNIKIELPEKLANDMKISKKSILMGNSFLELKEYLLNI